MKITLAILVLALVTIGCQLQLCGAEESASSSSLAIRQLNPPSLVRKKRLIWFAALLAPLVGWFSGSAAVGAGVAAAGAGIAAAGAGTAAAAGATVASVGAGVAAVGAGVAAAGAGTAAAVGGTAAVAGGLSTAAAAGLAAAGGAIGGAAIGAGTTYALTRKMLALTDNRPQEDNVELNLEIIDKFVNKNFNEDNPFKVLMDTQFPELKQYIHFSKDGYKCDQELCNKFGNRIYFFGICSPYSCLCSESGAQGRSCENSLIYDPVYDNCDIPTKVKICGM